MERSLTLTIEKQNTMNNIDVSYINPFFYVSFEADEEKLAIPFVGIYNSILNADIESAIECDMEYYESENEPIPTACKVKLRAIYEDYYNMVIDILGWDKSVARFGGIFSPDFYNYTDDTIFVIVKRDFIERFSHNGILSYREAIYQELSKKLDEKIDTLDEFDVTLYELWKDGVLPNGHKSRGYETIDNNLDYTYSEKSGDSDDYLD